MPQKINPDRSLLEEQYQRALRTLMKNYHRLSLKEIQYIEKLGKKYWV